MFIKFNLLICVSDVERYVIVFYAQESHISIDIKPWPGSINAKRNKWHSSIVIWFESDKHIEYLALATH